MDFIVVDDNSDPFAEPIDLAKSKNRFRIYRTCFIILVNIILIFFIWRLLARSKKTNDTKPKRSSSPPKLLFILLIISILLSVQHIIADHSEQDQNEWNLAPSWRERGDCAVNALFILLKIENNNITLKELKKHIPIDSELGSSFGKLKDTASKFGLNTEIRFVKPAELQHLPYPYILHGTTSIEKNIGHCLVIVGYDKKHQCFIIIDPTIGKYELKNEQVVKRGYSGYVLIPSFSKSLFLDRLTGLSLIVTGMLIFGLVIWYKK
jgi:hypothetical protein